MKLHLELKIDSYGEGGNLGIGTLLLGLVLVFLVTVPSPAMAQSCPPEPPNHVSLRDRTLAVMVFNRSDETWDASEVAPGKPPSITFNQNRLCFFLWGCVR